jgi:hypothetical protein
MVRRKSGCIYEHNPTISHFTAYLDEVAQMLKIAPIIFPGHSLDFGLLLDAISNIAEPFENLLGSYHDSLKGWLTRSFQGEP